jgi:DNA-binding transcriptional regulator YbjK
VITAPLHAVIDGQSVATDRYGIFAKPQGADTPTLWGAVTDRYGLITPDDVAQVWDETIGRPIYRATLRDNRFLLSTPLRDFDVLGDQHAAHLFVVNPMDGLHSAMTFSSVLRFFCLNQIMVAMNSAYATFKIIHDRDAVQRFRGWLNEAVAQVEGSVDEIQAAATMLAGVTVTEADVADVLSAAYPNPKRPRNTAPGTVMQKRYQRWEYLSQRSQAYREAAKTLFSGAGTGMDQVSMKGTAWGLLNAIVETEDYRQAKNDDDLDAIGDMILLGERADTKRRAFHAVMNLAA